MRVLCLDTETDGVDPSRHRAIEVAVTLYDCIHAAPIATYATLIEASANEAAHINKIPVELLSDAVEAGPAWARVDELVECADCIIAHNAPFDRRFTPKEIADKRPWIDSQRDIQWPEVGEGQKLIQVAVAHGVAVVGAHRALTDVDLLIRIFQRLSERGHDVAELLKDALRSKPLVQALVSFGDKQLAKDAGFTWEPEPKKRWTKRMSLEAAKKLPFKTKVLEA